ncbi:MAG: hypothetical protein NVS4B2_17010 [Chloroflexota bacterium]
MSSGQSRRWRESKTTGHPSLRLDIPRVRTPGTVRAARLSLGWTGEESESSSGLKTDLGIKYKSGIVQSRATRSAFLSDPSHRIVFHYCPKHASWMNQVELFLFNPGPQTTPARPVLLSRGSGDHSERVHRLLHSHDDQALQVHLSGQGAGRTKCRTIYARLY